MIIVVRNDEKISKKTSFLVNICRKNFLTQIVYVYRKEGQKFFENFFDNKFFLRHKTKSIFLYYLLFMLKSPKDLRNGIMYRLSLMKRKVALTENGFLSMLRRALYLRFGTSARANRLMSILNKMNPPKVFLIDEFLSLNCLDLKKLKLVGAIIYVSQDIAYNQYGFKDNFITRKLMFRLERDAIASVDLVIACSEMERLKYLEMGAKKAVFYPNIYPTQEFKPCRKDEMPSVIIVLRDHWGFRAEQSLKKIFNALACLERQVKVYLIGVKPPKVPQNIVMEYHEFIQSKLDYLRILSRAWIGINVGVHMAGTNERKYDYAEAGLVVFSDTLGVRGDLLPNEYAYVDSNDLTAKMKQLLEFDRKILIRMGKENRNQALSLAEKERQKMFNDICKIIVDLEG